MSNKLAASNILFIYQSSLVTHSEYIFCCFYVFAFVRVCVSTRSRLLVWHVYICIDVYNVGLLSRLLCMLSVGVPKWKCYDVYTCNISVVNRGWPICHCWYIFQSVCLDLFSCFGYRCCLTCGLKKKKECATDALWVNVVTNLALRRIAMSLRLPKCVRMMNVSLNVIKCQFISLSFLDFSVI